MSEGAMDWRALADAIVRVWEKLGWQSMVGVALILLGWKLIDSWGKRPK